MELQPLPSPDVGLITQSSETDFHHSSCTCSLCDSPHCVKKSKSWKEQFQDCWNKYYDTVTMVVTLTLLSTIIIGNGVSLTKEYFVDDEINQALIADNEQMQKDICLKNSYEEYCSPDTIYREFFKVHQLNSVKLPESLITVINFAEEHAQFVSDCFTVVLVIMDWRAAVNKAIEKGLPETANFAMERKGLAVASLSGSFLSIYNKFARQLNKPNFFLLFWKFVQFMGALYKLAKTIMKIYETAFIKRNRKVYDPNFKLPDPKSRSHHLVSETTKIFKAGKTALDLASSK